MKKILISLITTIVTTGSLVFAYNNDIEINKTTVQSDVDKIYNTIEFLSAAPRVAGTESELKTAEYIKQQFEKLGYETTLQPFPLQIFQHAHTSKVIIGETTFDARDFTWTNDGEINAEIEFVNLGDEQDLKDIDLKGKIALIERGKIPFFSKVNNVYRKGAIGAIIYNESGQPGLFNGSQSGSTPISTVAISYNDGMKIRKMLEENESLTGVVHVEGSLTKSVTSNNVIASKNSGQNKPIISIGAHHDSVEGSPGANDDASGTAVVLEMARVFANISADDVELRFLTFGAEEQGLIGSTYYVTSLEYGDFERYRGHFQLDMVGSKGAGDLIMFSNDGQKNLVTDTAALASTTTGDAIPYGKDGRSDHVPFQEAGIPSALFIHSPVEPWYHSPNDTFDKISKDKLIQVSTIIETSLNLLIDEYHPETYSVFSTDLYKNKETIEVSYPFHSKGL